MADRNKDFMAGRNGADELAMAIVGVALVLFVINLFAQVTPLTVIVLVLIAYAAFRMVSTKVDDRAEENDAFKDLIAPILPWLKNPKAAKEEHDKYVHATCPNCHQHVRVPRGKGHLRVTCPQCHQKFDVQS